MQSKLSKHLTAAAIIVFGVQIVRNGQRDAWWRGQKYNPALIIKGISGYL